MWKHQCKHDQQKAKMPGFSGLLLGKYAILFLIVMAILGIVVGLALSYWNSENANDKANAIRWIGLVGDLFLRAMKCIALPLIFTTVTMSILEMVSVGRAGSVGLKTLGFYLMTTLIAAIIGIITITIFAPIFHKGTPTAPPPHTIALGCNQEGYYMTETPEGFIVCAPHSSTSSEFIIEGLPGQTKYAKKTVSETIYEGIFTKIVTDNIVKSFASNGFPAVVFFAICFGCAIWRCAIEENADPKQTPVARFVKQLETLFMKMIYWVTLATPFAVFSLIARGFGGTKDFANTMKNVGLLLGAFLTAIVIHFLVTNIGIFWAITKRNPFKFLGHLTQAQAFGFASGSSAATVPYTMEGCRKSGWIPEPIIAFVVPLGATVNMDGNAIWYPMACVWLAYLNGIAPTVAQLFLLILLGTVGSIGTAPVASSKIVLILTAYTSVFGGSPAVGIPYLAAIDWIICSLNCVTNITGDSVVCGLVAHLTPDAAFEVKSQQEDTMTAGSATEDHRDQTDDDNMMVDVEAQPTSCPMEPIEVANFALPALPANVRESKGGVSL